MFFSFRSSTYYLVKTAQDGFFPSFLKVVLAFSGLNWDESYMRTSMAALVNIIKGPYGIKYKYNLNLTAFRVVSWWGVHLKILLIHLKILNCCSGLSLAPKYMICILSCVFFTKGANLGEHYYLIIYECSFTSEIPRLFCFLIMSPSCKTVIKVRKLFSCFLSASFFCWAFNKKLKVDRVVGWNLLVFMALYSLYCS